MISSFSLILLGLATFRLTRLLVYDQITDFIRRPFHEIEEEIQEDGTVEEYIHIKGKGIQRFIGELLSCHWCTGIWSAAFLYIGYSYLPTIFNPILIILSIAALAAILQVIVLYLTD